MWKTNEETAIEKLNLVGVHQRSAAPISPTGFVMFVIIMGSKINDGVYETQHEAFSSPVNDDIDSHVVGVDGYFLCICEGRRRTRMTELTANCGETRKSDPTVVFWISE